MTEAEAVQLVLKLGESFPRHILGEQEKKNYREFFARFEFGEVDSAIKAHFESSPAPVFSDLRNWILNRTPPRSDYQQRSRRERAEYENEEREKIAFFSSLPPEECDRRRKQILAKLPAWSHARLEGHALAGSKFLRNLIYAEEQSRRPKPTQAAGRA